MYSQILYGWGKNINAIHELSRESSFMADQAVQMKKMDFSVCDWWSFIWGLWGQQNNINHSITESTDCGVKFKQNIQLTVLSVSHKTVSSYHFQKLSNFLFSDKAIQNSEISTQMFVHLEALECWGTSLSGTVFALRYHYEVNVECTMQWL